MADAVVSQPVEASLERAAQRARAHVADERRAALLGLQLHVVHDVTPLVYTRYAPCLSFVLDGRKRSVVGDDDQRWGRGAFLITPVDLPVIAGVVSTGERGDFVSANWRLDPLLVAEVAAALPRSAARAVAPGRIGVVAPDLADAIDRLLRLLDAPEEIPLLAPLVGRELVLRLLQSDQAPRLLDAVEAAHAEVVTVAIDALTAGLAEPWTLERLSRRVGTSPATLTRRFRSLTGMPPMQYLKRLRLGEARRRLLVLGDSAAHAGSAVGYASASHFTRDYRAAYESTPGADAAEWRGRMLQVG